MTLELLDDRTEIVFKDILEHFADNGGKMNKAISDVKGSVPREERDGVVRIIEYLCKHGFITKKRVTPPKVKFPAGSSQQFTVQPYDEYTLTYEGENYFQMKDEAKSLPANKTISPIKEFKEYDVFISHASQDKLAYVEQLYSSLSKLGIKIFYDKDSISWGDNWKLKILNGVEKSEFAIIVISENFFGREWTEKELYEFLELQNTLGQKMILPLLYDIRLDDLKDHYPELTDIQSIQANEHDNNEIVILFAKELIKRLKFL